MVLVRKMSIYFFLILALGFCIFAPIQAASASNTLKTRQVWNTPLTYQLITINNPSLKYDGASYVHTDPKGNREYRVIMNTAYLVREASQIWNLFTVSRRPEMTMPVSIGDVLSKLTLATHENNPVRGIASSDKKWLVAELKKLEADLEYSAWYPYFERCSRASSSTSEARQRFVEDFSRIRMSTIEYHELSHLLDEQVSFEMKGGGIHHADTEKLLSHSEIRAFLTELAYGTNPHDTLWQVVTGVIDELRRGKNVDDSVRKLKEVLDFSRATFAQAGRSSILCLCRISKAQGQVMAWRIIPRYRISAVISVLGPTES